MSASEAAAASAVAVRGGVAKPRVSSPASKASPAQRLKKPSVLARKPRKKLAAGRVWAQTDLRVPKPKFSAVLGDRRGKRTFWSEAECEALRKGVEQYGTSWVRILHSSHTFHSARTPVDLKDKWRVLKKRQDRGEEEEDEDDEEERGRRKKVASLPAQTHFRSNATRKHVQRWTLDEQELLLEGVKTFGVGKWTTMLTALNGFHECRTSVDLKDKWRNLEKLAQKGREAA